MAINFLHRLRVRLFGGIIPEGATGVAVVGHRNYVGGRWDEIGQLQFDYLVSQGLRPEHVFLDIACGALRGGRHFIAYLDPGHYLGVDREEVLIEAGLAKELPAGLQDEKSPRFVVSERFEFERFGALEHSPDYALALSLFTHLTMDDIRLCLGNLRGVVQPGHRFFASYFDGDSAQNRDASHSLDHFAFSFDEMAAAGADQGWQARPAEGWEHPRNQDMIEYVAV